MLTVKKFGAVLDLSIGGYAAAVVGIILALLTIVVFPPDMDLQGKFHKFFSIKLYGELDFVHF